MVLGCVVDDIILMLSRLCCVSGNVCGLPVVNDSSFHLRTLILEEQNGVVPFHLHVIGVHQMNTSGSSCRTYVEAWLNGRGWMYLMDVL